MTQGCRDLRKNAKHSRDCLPVGSVRVRRQGSGVKARYVKVRNSGPESRRWVRYARWWWQKHRGAIPPGLRVYHKDGDSLNDDPGNYALMTPGDVIYLWHARNPDDSSEAFRKLRALRSAISRDNARIRRLTEVLPSRYYPVDHARQLVWNKPRKKKCEIYRLFGGRAAGLRGARSGAAFLGWPDLSLTGACILCALTDGPASWRQVFDRVNTLRRHLGWTPIKQLTNLFQFATALRRRGFLAGNCRGRSGALLVLTDTGRAARRRTCKVVAVLGDQLPPSYTRRGWL